MKHSFVIPCYRSEHTIGKVVEELITEIKKEDILDYEIVLVNDCSPDNAWSVIKKLTEKYPFVNGVNLSKNFGQHAALLAGYAKTSGDIVISLDDDGQAPINELHLLLKEINNGKDVVYAYYKEIKQTAFRRFGTKVATWMSSALLGAPKNFKGSSFYVAKRFVIDEMLRYHHAYPYLLGLVLRTTREIGYVETHHRQRLEGKSGYNFRSLLSLWINGFTAFSVKPLEVGVYLGIFFAFLGFAGVIVTVVHKLLNPLVAMGWSSLVSVILMIGGIILLMLGLIGEYVGRIYICMNKSPQYVIREDTFKTED